MPGPLNRRARSLKVVGRNMGALVTGHADFAALAAAADGAAVGA